MRVHPLGTRIYSRRRPTKTLALRTVVLSIILTLAWDLHPAWAQLGIAGFSLFNGFEDSMAGSAVAAGDFNNDGFDDLAVGAPGFASQGQLAAGQVIVFYGGQGQWSDTDVFWSELLGGVSETGARFGFALTTGDFDRDGHDDLVIGVPGKTVNGAVSAGEIAVVYGSPQNLDLGSAQFFSQAALQGAPEINDQFGSSLATGDLSADGVHDLAIGVHLEDRPGELGIEEDVGAVNIMFGALGEGLTTVDDQLLHEGSPGVDFNPNSNERFGFSLAIGQFTGSSTHDLAVGAPGEVVFGPGHKGAVMIFPGGPGGLDPIAREEVVLSQETDGILGTAEEGDQFGYALSVGRFDDNRWTDLAIGIPGESELGTTESGAVQVLYGEQLGGLTPNGSQLFFVEGSIDIDVDSFDRLGTSLATGDFDADGLDDLAIGAPLDNSLGFANAGEVTVLYGTPNGLAIAGFQVINMIFFDTLEVGDDFGHALAAGRFFSNRYNSQDLAVGVPNRGDAVGLEPAAGAALVIRSRSIFVDNFEDGSPCAWSNSNCP